MARSLTIGQALVLLTRNIDLPNGLLAAFEGMLVALIVNAGVPWPVRIPSFLATFGMLGVGETLALLLSHATVCRSTTCHMRISESPVSAGMPVTVIILVGIMLVAEIILRRTVFGFDLDAICGNGRGGAAYRYPRRTSDDRCVDAERPFGRLWRLRHDRSADGGVSIQRYR